MPRHDRTRQTHARSRIASAAARLIAESGLTDYGQAKRKALRQLGLPENSPLPDNAEVDAELRTYLDLYQGDEQLAHLRHLREAAIEIMELLADFNPYLTGSVLEGTAGPHSSIDILLFADNAKEIEIFLLDHGIAFQHSEPQNEKVDAVLHLETDASDVRLIIMPPRQERMVFKARDGRVRERIRLSAVRNLIHAQTAL